jgi:hypothetical protein
MDQKEAYEKIKMMHGAHRIPTLLKRVDLLARGKGQSVHKNTKTDVSCVAELITEC